MIRHVALVSEHASPLAALGGVDAGGQNVHVAALAGHLADRGVRVTVHTRRDDPDVPRLVEFENGVTVDHVPAGPPMAIPKDELLPYMPAFAADLRSQWTVDPPDLVHTHFWMSALAGLEAGHAAGIPVAQTFHALGAVKRRHLGDKDTSPPERLGLERRIVFEADRIIATCSDEVFELVRLGADVDQVTVIPCGVDPNRFHPEGPVEPVAARHRLLVVGRLVERKGVADVVAALAAIPHAELVIAGGPPAAELDDDPEVARLRAIAAHHGVGDRIDFRGRVSRADLPALIRSADLVVSTPWYEPFGIVPLEAMACGTPVVASAVGGLTDTVVDGLTGWHVPPRRPDALARTIREALANEAVLREVSRAGAQRVLHRYTWRRVADATLGAYEGMVRSARRVAVGRSR